MQKTCVNGESIIYGEDGEIQDKLNYVNGKRDGEQYSFYDNKQKRMVEIYKNGEIILCEKYTYHGVLTYKKHPMLESGGFIESYYVDGKLSYEYIHNEYGELIEKKIYYENGKQKINLKLKKSIYDGESILFDENGEIKLTVIYENGIVKKPQNGKYILFYDYNIEYIKTVSDIVDGKLNGFVIEYKRNGDILSKISYVNDKKNGIAEKFYTNGMLESKTNYIDDKIDGNFEEYYDDEKIKIKGNFVDDKKEGKFIYYYQTGIIKSIKNYKNNDMDGLCIENYEDGSCESRWNIVNRQYDGKFVRFHKNGKILSECCYVNGKMEGMSIQYTTSGNVFLICSYKNGQLTGKYVKYYYNTDQKECEYFYENGLENGEHIEYYTNGLVRVKYNCINDNIIGDYIRYHQNGKIGVIEHYDFVK